ncbi:MAG: FG-GAP repeat protein [Phycisphaerae bacterium]|nr:FG-GAP repeat protein [Phycisphaerae bacterium]
MKMSGVFHLALMLAAVPVCTGIDRGQAATPVHDVAVTDISSPSTCKQGETVPITITVTNQGTRRERFRLTLAEGVSGKEIASKEMALAKGWKDGSEGIADVVFNGEATGVQEFGSGIWSGGDINGDGYDDILISAPRWNESRGRVYLYYGGASIDPSYPDITFSGQDPNTHLGDYRGSSSCDVNLDGYDDILIGAWGYNNYTGRVYIHYGGPKIDTQADMVLDGEPGQEGWFGLEVTSSDIDDDGHEDVLVSAQNYNNGVGRVYIFWGNPMDTSPDVLLDGEGYPEGKPKPALGWETQGWFGRRIDANGDINGDGYNDILVGARYAGEGFSGSAYLFLGGKKDDMDTVCDYVFPGESPRDEMGSSGRIFDIDRDGFDDVLVGARFAANYRGRVYIYWGADNFDGSQPDVVLEGEAGSIMGADEIVCGYFNSDGYGDILVGAPAYLNRGRAYIFHGNTQALMDQQADYIFDGESGHNGRFGIAASSGDFNNDNHDDIVIGAWGYNDRQGRAYLFYGPFDSTTDLTFNWDTTNTSPGKHILKAAIAPVPGEEDITDNTMAVTIEVKGLSKTVGTPRELNQQ